MRNDLRVSNEVDPHFFLNSFTTLAYLIKADAEKAYLFNNKMAQVYKYFLLHKNKTLVPVADETEFIENYSFLLQVRYDDKLEVNIEPSLYGKKRSMIVPFVLQFLVDYAVKNTSFSEINPLQINIKMEGDSLEVVYESALIRQPKAISEDLKIIDGHYQRCCKKGVVIKDKNNKYLISLPLITSS